jgi:hypothetical protein
MCQGNNKPICAAVEEAADDVVEAAVEVCEQETWLAVWHVLRSALKSMPVGQARWKATLLTQ